MPPRYGIPLFSRTCRWTLAIAVLALAATVGFRVADLISAAAAAGLLSFGLLGFAGYLWLDAVTRRWQARREARTLANRPPAPDVESRIRRHL